MAELKHCEKCRMSTAHVDGECQRCVFKRKHAKPMTEEAKAKLKAAGERRKAERDAKRRDTENQTNTKGS